MSEILPFTLTDKDALIVADVQNDFLPGGALGIAESDQIIPVLNEYLQMFEADKAAIIASRDWHPPNHLSFKTQGGPWNVHCVRDTPGAQFNPDLKLPAHTLLVSKATSPSKEAYSVFDDTGLAEQLKRLGITRFFIGGLATDYCVVNSVVDGRRLGFSVVVLADATRGINVKPGDVNRAFEAMRQLGAVEATLIFS